MSIYIYIYIYILYGILIIKSVRVLIFNALYSIKNICMLMKASYECYIIHLSDICQHFWHQIWLARIIPNEVPTS